MKRSEAVVPVRLGRYTLYAEIGAGGMATVHLGYATGEGADGGSAGGGASLVAIKRLRPHFASEPDVVRSFLDEARLSARIRHPNVVDLRDVVTRDDEVFLVMEYLEGVPLAALARAGTTPLVPPDVLVSILASTLRGLHAAHEAVSATGGALNIVHRDVSPQNIVVGVDGATHVLDFGIAKAIGREQSTRDNRIKGKLAYMAPEQLSGRAVTRRTDLFAAGIVLWEQLAGERLFWSESEGETVTRVLMAPVRPPSAVNPAAPSILDPIVSRALERDPIKRFLTAEEMADALEAAVTPAPAEAVGAWVQRIGARDLARRAQLVRDVEAHARTGRWPEGARLPSDHDGEKGESTPAVGTHTAPAPLPIAIDEPRRRRPWLVAAAGIAVAALIGGLVARGRAKEPPPPAPLAATAPPPTPAPIELPSIASAPASPSPSPATPAPSSSSPSAPPPRAGAHHGVKPSPPARQRLYSRD